MNNNILKSPLIFKNVFFQTQFPSTVVSVNGIGVNNAVAFSNYFNANSLFKTFFSKLQFSTKNSGDGGNTNPPNHAPIAKADTYATHEDTSLVIQGSGVLSNDSDSDGNALSAILVSGPAHGSLTLNANGSFTYKSVANYNGPDSFSYKASDGVSHSNVAIVNINVTAVNDAPVAVSDNYNVNEDNVLNIATASGVLGNDSDVDGNALTAILVNGPAHGILALNSNGSFTYTPTANYNGIDSFTYRANDGALNSNIATVNLTVNSVNDAPVSGNESYSVNENSINNQNNPLLISAPGVLANDTDPDGDALTAVLVSGPAFGTLTLNQDGSFNYLPNQNYVGGDSFTYQAQDANGALGNVATVSILVNGQPVAGNESYSVNENSINNQNNPLLISAPGVLANDTDPEGDALTAVLVSGPAFGTLTLNQDGSFNYLPNQNYVGGDSFTYQAQDANGALGNVATVSILVNGQPVSGNESYSVNENSINNQNNPLLISAPGVLANDTDPDGDALTAVLVSGPAFGTLSLNSDGSFNYLPNQNYVGGDSFTYQAQDANGALGNVATVSILVNGQPVSGNESYSVNENSINNQNNPLLISAPGVLANDSDPEGGSLTAVLVSGPAFGTLTLDQDGSFTYLPNQNYVGGDSFTYQAQDANGALGNVATVSILVNGQPVSGNESYSVNENSINNQNNPLLISAPGVLANDTDPEGGILTAVLVSGPAFGTLSLNSDGSFNYLPNQNYVGGDFFTYQAQDANGALSNVATVSILVNGQPVSGNESYSVNENSINNQNNPLLISAPGVLANDTDPEGDLLTAVLVSGPAFGTLSLNSDGSFNYLPNQNYVGGDSFTYQAQDANGALGNVATVSILVNGQPVSGNESYSVNENSINNQNNPLLISAPGVLANDTDPEGDLLTAVLVSGPAFGTLSLNSDGSFNYLPNQNYVGGDSFTYQAQDANGALGNVATVSILVNGQPVSGNESYSVNENSINNQNNPLLISAPGVLANDTDPEGGILTAVLVSGPAFGTLSLNSDGSFNYLPNQNYVGGDSFTYQAQDANGALGNVATVSILVNGQPVSGNESYSVNENSINNQNNPLLISAPGVLANDTDPEGGSLTVVLVSGPAFGTLTLNQDGSFNYLPNQNYVGGDSFTYQAQDANGALGNVATVSILVNGQPVSGNESYSVNENSINNQNNPLLISAPGVLANDTDPEGDLLTAVLVSGPAFGTLTLNQDGSFNYLPNQNYVGGDSFTYQAQDANGALGNVATVSILVNGQPVANVDDYNVLEDQVLNILSASGLLANDTDPENSSLNVAIHSNPEFGTLILSSNGSFTYTPNANYFGADSFTYQVSDGSMNSNTATVNITVISDSVPAFTVQADIVNFNTIGAFEGDLYHALAGNDIVQLPDSSHLASFGYDSANPFLGGAGDDTITGAFDVADTIEGGAGADILRSFPVPNIIAQSLPFIENDAGFNTSVFPKGTSIGVSTLDLNNLTVANAIDVIDRDTSLGTLNGSLMTNLDYFTNTDLASLRVEATLDTNTDIDLYKIYLNQGERVTFDIDTLGLNGSTTFNDTFDTYLLLYSQDGILKAVDDDTESDIGSVNNNSLLTYITPSSGDYYLRVEAYNSSYQGNYQLNIQVDPNNLDIVSYANSPQGVSVNLATNVVSGGDAEGDIISGFANVIGSQHDDVLIGDSNKNVLQGGAGNDSINGGDGVDIINGGLDDDVIDGGLGNDTLQGDAGNDTINGGDGVDVINGGLDDDLIDGGLGNDTLQGDAGTDTLLFQSATSAVTLNLNNVDTVSTASSGGSGNDLVSGFEKYIGSNFNDTFILGAAAQYDLNGANGIDTLSFATLVQGVSYTLINGVLSQLMDFSQQDQLSALILVSIENLIGTAFDDSLTGDAGDNIINGGLGNDVLRGGGGVDTVTYASITAGGIGVNVNLATGVVTGAAGNDDIGLSSFANVIGSNFNDVLVGTDGDNSINGGFGTDTVDYSNVSGPVTVNLAVTAVQNTVNAGFDTLTSIENLTGGAYGDSFTGSSSNNTIIGGDGDDVIDGGSNNDNLQGGIGNDTLSFASFTTTGTGITANLANQGIAQNTGYGTDTFTEFENILGSKYLDTLTGDAGANTLTGGFGSDLLEGGAGADILIGGVDQNDANQPVPFPNIIAQSLPFIENDAGFNTSVFPRGTSIGVSTLDLNNLTVANAIDVIDRDTSLGTLNGSLMTNLDYFTNSHLASLRVEATLDTNTDIDLYKIYLNQGERVTFDIDTLGLNGSTTFNDTFDTYLLLYGQDGILKAVDDDTESDIGSVNNNSLLTYITPSSGDYYLRVEAFSSSYQGNYQLNIQVDPNNLDIASYEHSQLGVTVDLSLNGMPQTSVGDASGDVLYGIYNITGSAFGDTLIGNQYANILNGGADNDNLTGGAGADVFAYLNLTDAGDIITDFDSSEGDVLRFARSAFNGDADLDGILDNASDFTSGTSNDAAAHWIFNTTSSSLFYDADAVVGGSVLMAVFSNNATILNTDIKFV